MSDESLPGGGRHDAAAPAGGRSGPPSSAARAADPQPGTEAVLRRQALLDGVIESFEESVFSLDTEYRYASFNSAHAAGMRASYGVEIELGRSFFGYQTSARDLEAARRHLARALRGETVTLEARIGDPRRKQRWSAITQAPVRDRDGRIIGVAVVARDISERRRVENELRGKEEQLQAVLDNSPFGMHMYRLEDDDRLVFTGSNQTAGAMLGIDHAALVGLTLEEAFPGNAGTETATAYHRVAREGGRYESHEYAYDAGGIAGVFEIQAFRCGPEQMAVFFRDITQRRRLEMAVEESETRFRSLFENMQEGIAVCEMIYDDERRPVDWVYLDVNPSFEKMTGRGDLVGVRFSEAFPERLHDDPGLLDIYGGVAGGGEPAEFETYSKPMNAWLHVSAFGLAPGRFVAALDDITQRKTSAQQLAERERMLSTLMGNLPGMAYRCANDDVWTDEFVSAGAEELLGYAAQAKLEGTVPTLTGQVHPNDLERVREETQAALARHEPWQYRYRIVTADGRMKWVSERGVGVRDEAGDVVALEGFVHDVTAEHEAEERLATAAARWRETFDAMRDSVSVFDAEGRLVRCNGATAALTGRATADLLGRHCYEVFHGVDAYLEACPFVRARQSGTAADSIFEQDGRWLRATFQPTVDEEGVFRGGVHVVSDITELMLTEQRLRESLSSLEVMTEGAIAAIARAVEVRDPYTAGHQRRVSQLAEAIARRMGLGDERVHGVRVAGMVHDVGKIDIPAEILAKPGRLTDMEFELIKRHSQEGHDVLSGVEFPWPVAAITLQHHERLDGSGYPQGLRGDEILTEACVVAVADVVEAMASHRPYRPALGVEAALAEIEANSGTLYDADACAACLALFRDEGFVFEAPS